MSPRWFDRMRRLLRHVDQVANDDDTQRRFGRELAAIGGVGRKDRTDAYVIRRDTTVRGHVITVDEEVIAEVWAPIVVPSGLALHLKRGQLELPAGRPRDELTAPIERAFTGEHRLELRCDVERASCQFDVGLPSKRLDAIVDAVVAVARFDDGLTATLRGLPGAALMEGHELDPAVSFEEDGLLLGVQRGERTIAQLDDFPAHRAKAAVRDGVVEGGSFQPATTALLERAGDGDLLVISNAARFTWTGVERDRDRLLAGIRALRALRSNAGPYR